MLFTGLALIVNVVHIVGPGGSKWLLFLHLLEFGIMVRSMVVVELVCVESHTIGYVHLLPLV